MFFLSIRTQCATLFARNVQRRSSGRKCALGHDVDGACGDGDDGDGRHMFWTILIQARVRRIESARKSPRAVAVGSEA